MNSEIHNPYNIPPNLLGLGFRFLHVEELDGRHFGKAYCWNRVSKEWVTYCPYCRNKHILNVTSLDETYRIPIE